VTVRWTDMLLRHSSHCAYVSHGKKCNLFFVYVVRWNSNSVSVNVITTDGHQQEAAVWLAMIAWLMDGWMDGSMDRWMDRWMDGSIVDVCLCCGRNPEEVSNTCRGTINLANAFIHTQDSCSFVISSSGSLTFHLKANSEVERQRWVTALELAKSKAITMIESGQLPYCHWLMDWFNDWLIDWRLSQVSRHYVPYCYWLIDW